MDLPTEKGWPGHPYDDDRRGADSKVGLREMQEGQMSDHSAIRDLLGQGQTPIDVANTLQVSLAIVEQIRKEMNEGLEEAA